MEEHEIHSGQFWELAVIGQGYSALVNCSTRKASGRLPGSTVLVGCGDPWSRYVPHKMGQFPSLLSLPAFDQHPSSGGSDFLMSDAFASCNANQKVKLQSHGVDFLGGVVEEPITRTTYDGRDAWLITVNVHGRSVSIHAAAVDVCSGPGPARILSPGVEQLNGAWSPAVKDAFAGEVLAELKDRTRSSCFLAEDFMRCAGLAGERLVVVGEGPLTAGVVEHALSLGFNRVVWVCRAAEHARISFPPSCRYDQLLSGGCAEVVRGASAKIAADAEAGKVIDISPVLNSMRSSDSRLTMLFGVVSKVEVGRLSVVEHAPCPLGEVTEEGWVAAGRDHLHLRYDALVVSASSETGLNERRSAAALLQSVPKEVDFEGFAPIVQSGMFVGLEACAGGIRVLGAAARLGPLLTNAVVPDECESAYLEWHNSLCAQARMAGGAMGITSGAATIAMANEFYCDGSPDECAQTMPRIPDCLGRRADRVAPYTGAELDGLAVGEKPRLG